jgi:hypothetical protein
MRRSFISMHPNLHLRYDGGINIRLTTLYLIACFLLLAPGAAMDNKTESIDDILAMNLSNQTTQYHSSLNYTTINSSEFVSSFFNFPNLNSSEFNSSESGSPDLNSSEIAYYEYSQIQSEPEVISLAFPAKDLNGDNATDLLVMNISSDANTGAFNSEISAFSGGNGSTLWQKEYPGSLVYATTAGDLNGDGQTDVMIN